VSASVSFEKCLDEVTNCTFPCQAKSNKTSSRLGSGYIEKPAIARNNDKSKNMAALIHRTSPTSENIYVSSSSGGVWGALAQATTSGTPKSNVDIGPYNNSGFALAWTENYAAFDTTGSIDSLLKRMTRQEIYTAVSSNGASWGEPVQITNDNRSDGMAKIAGSTTGLYLVWVRQYQGTDYDPTKMRIFYSTYTGSSWRTPQEIPGQIGYNIQPSLTIDPATGEGVIVWIEDVDGDINTFSDRTLKMSSIDAAGTPSAIETVIGDIGPFSPSIVMSDNGHTAIAYEAWSWRDMVDAYGVTHRDTVGLGDGTKISASIKHDNVWTVVSLSTDDTTGFGQGPKASLDDSGYVHVAYRGFEKGEGAPYDGEIYMAYMNLASGPYTWTKPKKLTDDTIYTDMGDIATGPDGKIEVIYVKDSLSPNPFPNGSDYIYFTTFDRKNPDLVCGDADASGTINVSDAVYYINYIFASGPLPKDPKNGDYNCDNHRNLTDIVFLINYIFANGQKPCAGCK
jgi:hypothetical protein